MIELGTLTGQRGAAVNTAAAAWSTSFAKLLAHDASLWTGADEAKWLGWLDIVARETRDLPSLQAFADHVRAQGTRFVVLIGMGGSSLGAEVLAQSFGHQPGWPELFAIDSTSPDQIAALEARLDLAHTLFIVASKSGSTLEPNILKDYFHARITATQGAGTAGRHFAAITDPGSSMEKEAKDKDFAFIFYGEPSIGGRYSVLSRFGLVPAAAMGLDLPRFLKHAADMVARCRQTTQQNPGLLLGLSLGLMTTEEKRDKITISASLALLSVGGWLEQLIAESTGKNGKGLIPVDLEPLAAPSAYGNDRTFLHVALAGETEPPQLAALEEAGHPVLRLTLSNAYELGELFYLSEIAVAVAGAVLNINPFNQPDVEASKIKSRELTDAYETTGQLPLRTPFRKLEGITLYADANNEKRLSTSTTLTDILSAHFHQAKPGDYAALLAFIEQSPAHWDILQNMRTRLRDQLHIATCAEFGPRFLHSTGQAYKGGPNSGIFLTISAEPKEPLAIPGHRIGFGVVQQAQAMGDFEVLNERGRRALWLHLDNAEQGLATIAKALQQALA